jgi:hypothetical protein
MSGMIRELLFLCYAKFKFGQKESALGICLNERMKKKLLLGQKKPYALRKFLAVKKY